MPGYANDTVVLALDVAFAGTASSADQTHGHAFRHHHLYFGRSNLALRRNANGLFFRHSRPRLLRPHAYVSGCGTCPHNAESQANNGEKLPAADYLECVHRVSSIGAFDGVCFPPL